MHFNIIKKDLVLLDDKIEINFEINNNGVKKTNLLLYDNLRSTLFDSLYNGFHLAFKK
jgi:hypothetical protein